jgi:putative membrane fusion protein
MANEIKEKSKNHNTRNTIFFCLYIIVVLALVIVVVVMPKIDEMMKKTIVIKHGELPITDSVEALIVRDETLFLAAGTGQVSDKLPEGTKVRAGTHILNVNQSNPEQLPEYSDILVRAGDSAQSTGEYNAGSSAMVSYFADGLEKKWTPENIHSISKSDIASSKHDVVNLTAEAIRAGQPIYKLTDNNIWYMVFFISPDSEQVKYLEVGKSVKVNINKDSFDAQVLETEKNDKDLRIILKCENYYKDMARHRVIKINLVSAEYSGLIVPEKSLYIKGKKEGVWTKKDDGSFIWVEVNVLRRAKGKVIISSSTFYNEEKILQSTVSYYEEILADPKADGY